MTEFDSSISMFDVCQKQGFSNLKKIDLTGPCKTTEHGGNKSWYLMIYHQFHNQRTFEQAEVGMT